MLSIGFSVLLLDGFYCMQGIINMIRRLSGYKPIKYNNISTFEGTENNNKGALNACVAL